MLKRILPLVLASVFTPTGFFGTNAILSKTNLIFPISEKGLEIVDFNTKFETMKSEAESIKEARLEEERKKQEEFLAQQKTRELEELRQAEESKIDLTLTFYTSLDCENGYGAITCTGEKLGDEVILASNYYKLGTLIDIEGYGTLRVADRGSSNFDSSNRVDVYIPRRYGESNSSYYKRVNNMGLVKTKGRIVN